MQPEIIPIAEYVTQKYNSRSVQKIVEEWRVEPELVIQKLIEHFREMGIFYVTWNQEQIISKNILYLLRHSPDIITLVKRAKLDEIRRHRSRHPD